MTGTEVLQDGASIVRGACHHDCPDTCAWEVTVEDGHAVQLRGVADHPFTAGDTVRVFNDRGWSRCVPPWWTACSRVW